MEEDKNRIIIERVIGEKAKLSFFNDRDVKEEPIFDTTLDPQPEVSADYVARVYFSLKASLYLSPLME